MSATPQPESSGNARNIIIAVVVIALLLVGYCATRVVSVARTIVGSAQGIAARSDTTHHVAAGSAVYLGDTKLADIVKVIVIHPDTTTPAKQAHGVLDSTIQAALRQGSTVYTTAQPTADAAAQLKDFTLIGNVEGTYDSDTPVKITLTHRTTASTTPSIPPVQLIVPGRQQPISVY